MRLAYTPSDARTLVCASQTGESEQSTWSWGSHRDKTAKRIVQDRRVRATSGRLSGAFRALRSEYTMGW
jgi:hypothetical protein